MDLNEFKVQMDSEAQRRCKVLEEENKNLRIANGSLLGLLKERDKDMTALQNRCFALTGGTMCFACGILRGCSGRTYHKLG